MTNADLEVCRVTAEALGKKIDSSKKWVNKGIPCIMITVPRTDWVGRKDNETQSVLWNPLEIPAQMAECVDKLLSLGYWLALDGRAGRYHQSFGRDGVDEGLSSNCPWREFPARALAEVWRRK